MLAPPSSQRRLARLQAHLQPTAAGAASVMLMPSATTNGDGFDRTDAARFPDGDGLLEYSVVYTDRALNL